MKKGGKKVYRDCKRRQEVLGNALGRVIILYEAPSEGYGVCDTVGGGAAQLEAVDPICYTFWACTVAQ